MKIVGPMDSGLPHFGLPHVSWTEYLKLAGSGVGILLVGFAEGLGAAKTYAVRSGYEISPNRELVGIGAANIASGLSAGMVVNGSAHRPAIDPRTGGSLIDSSGHGRPDVLNG